MVTGISNYFVTKLFPEAENGAESPENRAFFGCLLSKNLFKMSITFFHGLKKTPIM